MPDNLVNHRIRRLLLTPLSVLGHHISLVFPALLVKATKQIMGLSRIVGIEGS